MLSCYQLTLPLRQLLPQTSFCRSWVILWYSDFNAFEIQRERSLKEGVHGFCSSYTVRQAELSTQSVMQTTTWTARRSLQPSVLRYLGCGSQLTGQSFSSLTSGTPCLDSKQVSRLTVGFPRTQLLAFLQGPSCSQVQ